MELAAKVLIVSDSAAAGTRADLAGPLLRARLAEAGFDVVELKIDGVAMSLTALSAPKRIVGVADHLAHGPLEPAAGPVSDTVGAVGAPAVMV